jgi:hypothetical protein
MPVLGTTEALLSSITSINASFFLTEGMKGLLERALLALGESLLAERARATFGSASVGGC